MTMSTTAHRTRFEKSARPGAPSFSGCRQKPKLKSNERYGAPDWQKGTGDVCCCKSEDFKGDESSARHAMNFVRIPLNDEMYKMLKDLERYYGTDFAEIAAVPFKAALEVFLEEQKKKCGLTGMDATKKSDIQAGRLTA
ncbi:MAG: hypothetical protein DMF76_21165 [Acidobacteria bacterium]|nr:MAG: hypothetical protein DMF76_21165 [Acidobacteriota bacterium]